MPALRFRHRRLHHRRPPLAGGAARGVSQKMAASLPDPPPPRAVSRLCQPRPAHPPPPARAARCLPAPPRRRRCPGLLADRPRRRTRRLPRTRRPRDHRPHPRPRHARRSLPRPHRPPPRRLRFSHPALPPLFLSRNQHPAPALNTPAGAASIAKPHRAACPAHGGILSSVCSAAMPSPAAASSPADPETRIAALGRELFDEVRAASRGLFSASFYSDKLLEWAMQDEDLRVALFRFVDVLPSLHDDAAVVRHAQEYLRPAAARIPGLLKWGLDVAPDSLAAGVTAKLIRRQVRSMAGRFIIGATPEAALPALRRLRKNGRAFTVDLLGEAVVSERESEDYLARYLDLIDRLADAFPHRQDAPKLLPGHPGEATPRNISVKLSALYSQIKTAAPDRAANVLSRRLGTILDRARAAEVFVYVDMEDTRLTDLTLEVVRRTFGAPAHRDHPGLGLVLQAYLRRTEADLGDLLAWMQAHRGAPTAVRLVKGAYWDTETINARLAGWPLPVYQEKSASDHAFERLAARLLENRRLVLPAFGSHNIRSLTAAIVRAENLGLGPQDFEIQALYGMADPIKAVFARRGYLVREYTPVGELIPGMGYLVRRLLENTSNQGFLRQGFHEGEDPDHLLAPPAAPKEDGRAYLPGDPRRAFANCPPTDFTLRSAREALAVALRETSGKPLQAAPVIAGKTVSTSDTWEVRSPENLDLKLGTLHAADEGLALSALEGLQAFFPRWRATPVEERCELLFKTADLAETRRHRLAALIILETGKPWVDADADVAEAIDFLRYYAHQARALFSPRRLTDLPGEDNRLFYEPRGVAAVIGPWNFPLAIPCGMFAAALVTGNCPALKPAEQSSLTAAALYQLFLDAGLPPEAAAFLPGRGETVGTALARHPAVATIAFTGSQEVGLGLVEQAARTGPGQRHVRRVIAEMGGKNAIVVDADADLDEAVKGILPSAFGYAGQKCSACSRLYVVESAWPRLRARLAEAIRSLVVGPASDPASLAGPVIDADAHARLRDAVDTARDQLSVLAECPLPADLPRGHYVAPIAFEDVPPEHDLMRRELFGPILAIARVASFEEGIECAIDSEYALTGAVFTRSPAHLEQAVRDFRVGNLYLNRGCTGSIVGRHPFGGAARSGVGSKAGGPDYLHQFVLPRAISENTLRQGFAPGLSS
ncbi:MAG: aldehyde dehydrogenase family protein [Puniceicoccaceae bacterium]|nr:MAG: aldehyde dehydrogenase family protein [Puniceicoccaceae bacterium]